MNRKSSIVFLLSFIMLVSILAYIPSPSFRGPDNSRITRVDTHRISDVDILIESDSDWTTYSSTGNGSAESPYVIENLILGVVNIFTSTNHFVIRNCEITGEVLIEDSSNGTLENIVLREFAVFRNLSDFLFHNLTRGNGGGDIGIAISFSENITFQHSRVTGVYDHGLILEECTNGLILENTFSECGKNILLPPPKFVAHDTSSPEFRSSHQIHQVPLGGALEVDTCSNIVISKNIFIFNIGGGILAKDSENLTILSNNETWSARGFGFSSSTRVNVSDNHANRGVYFHNCNESIVANNILGFYGLELKGETLSHFLISESNNSIQGEPLLYLKDCNNQSVENKQLGQVYVVNCTRINFQNIVCLSSLIIHNSSEVMIEDTRTSSITIQTSNDCRISDSVFRSYITAWETGVWLDNASRCQVVNNEIHTYNGLNIDGPSIGALVANNTITDVSNSGIRLIGVNNARIINNTVEGCAHTYLELHTVQIRTAVILNMHNSLFVNNSIVESLGHGIYVSGGNNTLFGNTIAGNEGRNAEDNGSNNQWDNGISLGNFWDDYGGFGYYYIPGLAQSVDRYPQQAPGYEYTESIANAIPVVIGSVTVVVILAIFLFLVIKR